MYSTLIDCVSLSSQLDNPDWLVIDCRYDLMNRQAGLKAYQTDHIPGAVYVDVHDDLSGPPVTNRGRHPLPTAAAMLALFSRSGINRHTQVVIYDASFGAFAARLWWMLRHMQHERCAVLDGGWQAWLANNLPVTNELAENKNTVFSGTAKTDDLVSIEEVELSACLIDSREPERYRGEVEPIDSVAGHIPGALNRFWRENLDESGTFKPSTQLNSEFHRLFNGAQSEQTVFYCGSGITACHNLLAVAYAGLPTPRLYAGSWSEWCNTKGKPIATGD